MLSRLYEWYRIVNPQPSSDTVDRRTLAAKNLIKLMDEAENFDLVLGCAEAVVGGFDSGFAQGSPTVQAVVSSIKTHDSAFPQDLTENAVELRAIAAVAIGELLLRNEDEADKAPAEEARLVSAIVQSGLHLRPAPKARFVKQLLDELLNASRTVLTHAAEQSRLRVATIDQLVKTLQDKPENVATSIQELTRQAAIDREELNILWWMFAACSSTTGVAFLEMAPGAAALACGAELGGLCLLPPARSHEAMVRRAFVAGRSKPLAERTLDKIVAEWDVSLLRLLATDEAAITAQTYPMLFPLSWLSDRLLSSHSATGWAPEFEKKTGLSASASYSHIAIAEQAMIERATQREYHNMGVTVRG